MTYAELHDKADSSMFLARTKFSHQQWSEALEYCRAATCALQELTNRSRGMMPPKQDEPERRHE